MRAVLRGGAILGCFALAAKAVACDPSAAATRGTFVDTDGDGISDTDELIIHGTSPLLADTDGDGMSDYEEIVQRQFDANSAPLKFNPRIADVPALVVRIASPPLLTIRITETTGETWTYETSTTFEDGIALTTSATEEVTFSASVGGSETIGREVSVEFQDDPLTLPRDAGADARADAGREEENDALLDPNNIVFGRQPLIFDPGGPDVVVLTSSVASTVDWDRTDSLTLSFTAEQTREFRRAITFAQAYAVNREVSASSADLKILIELFNRGNVPFTITNLILSASTIIGPGVELPVGNLDLNTFFNNFVPWSIAPGGRQGPVNYVRDQLTLDQAAQLGDMTGLRVSVGVYELTDERRRPYVFDVPAITTRTATLDIDYGGRRPRERFLVATNLDPARPGVSMDRALSEILRVPFEADYERGLTSMRNVATQEPGVWTVEVRHNDAGENVTTAYAPPYDFRNILLRAGDVVHIGWSGQ